MQLTMQSLFDTTKQTWLQQCRTEAKKLLRVRESITSEDVLKVCPRPHYLHRNTVGAIFDGQFYPVGFVKAKHPEAKGRWIRQWKVKES